MKSQRKLFLISLATAVPFSLSSCTELKFTMIPDQADDIEQARAAAVTDYLSDYLTSHCKGPSCCFDVTFVASSDYANAVDMLLDGVVGFGWYGGLTAVDASLKIGKSIDKLALAQRLEDTQFTSTFIQRDGLDIMNGLQGVQDRSLAYGSEISTSGHLMPFYFLQQASGGGVTPASFMFTGSHDNTVDTVASGAEDVGVLNSLTWERRVSEGTQGSATAFYTTDEYVDYLWLAGRKMGKRLSKMVSNAFLELAPGAVVVSNLGEAVLDSFSTVGFINVDGSEYSPIESIGCQLELIEAQLCSGGGGGGKKGGKKGSKKMKQAKKKHGKRDLR